MTEPSRRRSSGAGAAILALTQGDPAGIGPEITLKAWLRRDEIGLPFCLLGDPDLHAPDSRAPRAGASRRARDDRRRRGRLPPRAAGRSRSARRSRPSPASPIRRRPPRPSSRSRRRFGSRAPERPRRLVTNPIAKHVLYAGRASAIRATPSSWRRSSAEPGADAAASGHDAVERGARRRAGDGPHAAGAGPREP